MSMREGRGRPRRDYPSRSEEKPHHGRGSNPPSRHLWVGNLPHHLMESDVAHYFLHFGELESVAFQPGRSYAFINYRNDEDAFAAIKELQGFVIEGNPLRIEFAKAEKSLASARDADYSERRDNHHPRGRESPFTVRDSRTRRSSPEFTHSTKSKMNDKNADPSEVLWIGFPAQLKVDEFVLRKAFSPFGDIEKITAFPGRTYAFVRFRDVMAASRAKETLQGKLFGNPRVHICFAKNDSGTSNRERSSTVAPPSPHAGTYERAEYFENYQSDRNFGRMSGDPIIRSPPYAPNLDRGDRMRNTNLWQEENDFHEQRRFPGQGSELRLHPNAYDHPNSPPRNMRAHIREYSPKGFPRQGPIYDDPWDLPEDVSLVHGTKKLKTDAYPNDELPEYPLSDLEKSKHKPQSGLLDNNYDSRRPGYRPIPERLMNSGQLYVEQGDHWNAPHDDFQVAPTPMRHLDQRKLTPDARESSSKEVWRWEGLIAKGGTTVCRARCFPVGKPPDMVLPEVLDCRARTSLDMLAKHYYQASSAWVVFLAPANDPDISYYNEFMSYLGEKQRAAVVKLDERNTLFLVPPSEFSEKVLKVPGKLSISGVVLRLDPPGSSYGSQHENRENYPNPISPSGPYLPPPPPPPPFAHMRPVDSQGLDYDYAHAHAQKTPHGANWSPHELQNPNPPPGSMGPPYSRPIQDTNYTPSSVNSKWPAQENHPIPSSGLPAEQLAQLASSLLGQQGASGSGEYKPSGNSNQLGYQYGMQQNYELPADQMQPDFPPPQFGQGRQMQQQQQQILASEQDDPEADPQKRLQATLQLAAALLQQIQQGKGT